MQLKRLLVPILVSASVAGTHLAAHANDSVEDPIALGLPVDKSELVEISWQDLMPPGEEELIMQIYQQQMLSLFDAGMVEEGSPEDVAMQFGTFNTVPELDGRRIRLPGYTVPFDFSPDAKVSDFLLVPYFGACLHAPPPPPNQTVYIQTDTPIRLGDLAEAVWIEGVMNTETSYSDLADAAYTITVEKIVAYEY